jgi:hypothetical protein
MFSETSRYHTIETDTLETAERREIIYLRRRFLPPASQSRIETEHVVTEGERLDTITAQYLGDAELFWRLCDANNAMHPADLTAEIGRRLRIPLFEES